MLNFLFIFIVVSNYTLADEVNCSQLQAELNSQIKELKKFQKKSFIETYHQFLKTKSLFLRNTNTSKNPIKDENLFWDKDGKFIQYYSKIVQPNDVPITKDKCAEKYVDLSKMPDNQMQEQTNWCGCFAATDNLSFYLNEKISVYDVCAQINHKAGIDSKKPIVKQTGNLLASINSIIENKKGICLEKDFKPPDNNWGQLSSDISLINIENISLNSNTCEVCKSTFLQPTFEIKQILDKLSPNKKILALIDVQCVNRKKVDFTLAKNHSEGFLFPDQESFYNKIDDLISNENPVYISSTVKHIEPIESLNYSEIDTFHAMNIVGRKWNHDKNRCEYLVRNSWGKKCQGLYNTKVVNCVEGTGNFWISREQLFPAIEKGYDTSKLIELKK